MKRYAPVDGAVPLGLDAALPRKKQKTMEMFDMDAIEREVQDTQ